MRTSIVVTMLLLTALGCQSASKPRPDRAVDEAAVVQRDVVTMSDALFAGDIETLLHYTYPPALEKLGGVEGFTTVYKAVAASQERAGIQRDSLTFPEPPQFIDGKDGRRFVIQPTRIVVSGGGNRALTKGFRLGVKEPGAGEWKYIPGQLVRRDLLRPLLPDFPRDQPFPERATERIEAGENLVPSE